MRTTHGVCAPRAALVAGRRGSARAGSTRAPTVASRAAPHYAAPHGAHAGTVALHAPWTRAASSLAPAAAGPSAAAAEQHYADHTAPRVPHRAHVETFGGVPLAVLSIRSLADHCGGGYTSPVDHIEELPNAPVDELRETLAARHIGEADFILWHNILAQRTWPDAAALLERADTLPPFVLQRALRKVRAVSHVVNAIRLVERHIDAYPPDTTDRLVLFLAQHCLQARGWHASRRLTDMVLACAEQWLVRPLPNVARVSRVLAAYAAELFVAGDDARARAALHRVLDFAEAHTPDTAAQIAVCAVAATRTRAERRRAVVECLDVPLVARLLRVCRDDRLELLALGVRVAARRSDRVAATWAAELGPQAQAYRGTLSALLRATARAPGGTTTAWALFDHAVHDDHALDTHKWAIMLRAAAEDKRVPPERVEALLALHEGDAHACASHAARWHAPRHVVARLCAAAPAYTAIIDGFAARGELCRAFAVWDAMIRRGVPPDAWALASLCRVYTSAVRLDDAVALVRRAQGPSCQAGAPDEPLALSIPRALPPAERVHFPPPVPSSHLLNTLLSALLDANAPTAVCELYSASADAADVMSLDLLVRAGALAVQHGAAGRRCARAVRTHFGALLRGQHPELGACRSALTDGATWLLHSELRLQRLEARMRGLFARDPVPIQGAPAYVCFDARIFYHYCELLLALARAPTPEPGAWEELFLVPAWMRELDVAPLPDMLCLVIAALDEALPPGIAGSASDALRAWLRAWTQVPTDDAVGAYIRAHS